MTLGHEQRYLTDFGMERDGAEVAEIRQSTFLERIGGSYEQNATFPFDKAQAKATHSKALCARLHIDQNYLDGRRLRSYKIGSCPSTTSFSIATKNPLEDLFDLDTLAMHTNRVLGHMFSCLARLQQYHSNPHASSDKSHPYVQRQELTRRSCCLTSEG
jgi:hypothetical protein